MNASGDEEERTNNHHEGRILHSGMNNTPWLLQDQQIVKTNNASERDTEFVIMAFPMMLRNQRATCDREQQANGNIASRLGSAAIKLRIDITLFGIIEKSLAKETRWTVLIAKAKCPDSKFKN